MFDDLKLH